MPPDPDAPIPTPPPVPGPWPAQDESTGSSYRIPGGTTAEVSQAYGSHGYATIIGPTGIRMNRAQFASSAIAKITTNSTANYPVKVVPASSSRRRIVTGNDGGIGIRG